MEMGLCPCPHVPRAGVVRGAWHQLPKMSTVSSMWEALAGPVYLHFPSVFSFLPFSAILLPQLSFGQLLSGHT